MAALRKSVAHLRPREGAVSRLRNERAARTCAAAISITSTNQVPKKLAWYQLYYASVEGLDYTMFRRHFPTSSIFSLSKGLHEAQRKTARSEMCTRVKHMTRSGCADNLAGVSIWSKVSRSFHVCCTQEKTRTEGMVLLPADLFRGGLFALDAFFVGVEEGCASHL